MGLTKEDIKSGKKQINMFEQIKIVVNNVRTYQRRVIRQGNSFMVGIPASIIKESGIWAGDDVKVSYQDNKIIIEKL